MATPDPGPERITDTHLDRVSLVSHPGVHHGRDMAGLFFKESWRHDANDRHSHGACHQLCVAVKKLSSTGEIHKSLGHLRLLVVSHSYEGRSGTGCRKRSQNCKRDAKRYAFSASAA